ncbi:MAG: DUF4058 family protein [Isosphaeraceae bacterium]
MPSPFPGMDPYLEAPGVWPDFHGRFLSYLAEHLGDTLPDRYIARIDERIRVIGPDGEEARLFAADVAIERRSAEPPVAPPIRDIGGVAILEPVTVPFLVLGTIRESSVKILSRPDHDLVTVIELLSPSNKSGADRGAYLNRRGEILRRGVNLVELDFLTRGSRLPMAGPLPAADYYAFVGRADRYPDCDVYAWSIRDRLPHIPVPLRVPDADGRIDLAAVFRQTYDRGHFGRSLDYSIAQPASLSAKDADWADSIARPRPNP